MMIEDVLVAERGWRLSEGGLRKLEEGNSARRRARDRLRRCQEVRQGRENQSKRKWIWLMDIA
jgi:hypothetical protein